MKNPLYYTLTVLCLVLTLVGNAATVRLRWDPLCSPSVNRYEVFYTTNELTSPQKEIEVGGKDDCGVIRPSTTNIFRGNYTNYIQVIGRTNVECQFTNLIVGVKYYFSVRAVDNIGLQGMKSMELIYVVPAETNIAPKVSGVTVLTFEK